MLKTRIPLKIEILSYISQFEYDNFETKMSYKTLSLKPEPL